MYLGGLWMVDSIMKWINGLLVAIWFEWLSSLVSHKKSLPRQGVSLLIRLYNICTPSIFLECLILPDCLFSV